MSAGRRNSPGDGKHRLAFAHAEFLRVAAEATALVTTRSLRWSQSPFSACRRKALPQVAQVRSPRRPRRAAASLRAGSPWAAPHGELFRNWASETVELSASSSMDKCFVLFSLERLREAGALRRLKADMHLFVCIVAQASSRNRSARVQLRFRFWRSAACGRCTGRVGTRLLLGLGPARNGRARRRETVRTAGTPQF